PHRVRTWLCSRVIRKVNGAHRVYFVRIRRYEVESCMAASLGYPPCAIGRKRFMREPTFSEASQMEPARMPIPGRRYAATASSPAVATHPHWEQSGLPPN